MTEITLPQLLHSREERAAMQRRLIDAYQMPLVSFTVNMPGAVKDCPQGTAIFKAGSIAIRERLAGRVVYRTERQRVTGWEGYYICAWESISLKKAMCRIEDAHPLGRLFDIDVLDGQCCHLSRWEMRREKRPCLICGNDGDACARSRAHPLPQLLEKIDQVVSAWQTMKG